MCVGGSLRYAAVTVLAKTEKRITSYAVLFAGMARLTLGRIAVLQFVYPLTAVLVDWLVYGRTLNQVQMGGVLLMALALWTIRLGRSCAEHNAKS